MSASSTSITSISLNPPLRTAQLGRQKSWSIDLQPDAAQREDIATLLGLEGLRKFRFTGQLRPVGASDWELTGKLGATVIQPCAVTLNPVITRIDEDILRRFVANLPEPEALEVEMPEDDSLEPLGAEIDITAVALEALSLALPAFPRHEEADNGQPISLESSPPGAAPLQIETTKPFAGLAAMLKTANPAATDSEDETE